MFDANRTQSYSGFGVELSLSLPFSLAKRYEGLCRAGMMLSTKADNTLLVN